MSHTENDSGNSTPTKRCSKQINVETSSMVNGQRVLTTDILSWWEWRGWQMRWIVMMKWHRWKRRRWRAKSSWRIHQRSWMKYCHDVFHVKSEKNYALKDIIIDKKCHDEERWLQVPGGVYTPMTTKLKGSYVEVLTKRRQDGCQEPDEKRIVGTETSKRLRW